jgi:ABC-type glutathione transport system ATPase component
MPAADPPSNPFPGLRPFRSEEDYLFFGREDQVSELLSRLGDHRFVTVVGTSGSGKSSLVRCGLLSELQGGRLVKAGSAWEFAVMQPGGDPVAHLAQALLEAGLYEEEDPDTLPRIQATLRRSRFGLIEAVKQSQLKPDANLLLVVDQFEEIFRFHEATPGGHRQRRRAHLHRPDHALGFPGRLLEVHRPGRGGQRRRIFDSPPHPRPDPIRH